MQNDKFKSVLTEDGSYSLCSENFKELMHTRHGAYNESVEKHIYPSRVLDLKKENIHVLDIGFGLGYNILALLHLWTGKGHIHIDSFELDQQYMELLREIKFNDEKDSIYKKIFSALKNGFYREEHFSINIHFGDARKNLVKISETFSSYDAVFQDPFSPSKNCELWTLEYFNLMYKLMNENAILTTYSNAYQVRRAMVESGFFIARNNNHFRKEGTLCYKKNGLSEQITNDEIKEIYQYAKSLPFRDSNFSLSRDEIYENRKNEMKQLTITTKDHQVHS